MHSRFATVLARSHFIAALDRLRSRVRWVVVVFSIVASGALVAFTATPSSAANGKQTLAGAWNITIAFDDPSLVGCTTPGLNTADGGVVAQGCDLSESPGYGQWRRTGNGQFGMTFRGVTFGPVGTGITGSYKVRATLLVDGETFSGPFVTDVFDLDATLLVSASGTVTAQRIGIEPF